MTYTVSSGTLNPTQLNLKVVTLFPNRYIEPVLKIIYIGGGICFNFSGIW